MTQEHPITPPPELVAQWWRKQQSGDDFSSYANEFATFFARWGANQELEACCEWLNREMGTGWGHGTKLRVARRPKPPSLKEQALEQCNDYIDPDGIIRRALESLPD